MAKRAPDLPCPKCYKPIGFLAQVEEWVEFFMGDGEILPPAFLNLWCKHCKDMTSSIVWEENDEGTEIEIPELHELPGGVNKLIVNMPKSQKKQEPDNDHTLS